MAAKDKILFISEEEVSDFFPVNVALNFDSMVGPIQKMQDKWIVPILGKEELATLVTAYHDKANITNDQLDLIHHIQSVLAPVSFEHAIPFLNLNMVQGGFSVNVSEKTAPAAQWRINQLRDELYAAAQLSMDTLLEYLEENHALFLSYTDSQERLNAYSNLLNTTAQMREYLAIPVGRFILFRMRSIIKRIEKKFVETVLCEPLFLHLKETVQQRGDLGVYEPLMPMIHEAVSHLAIAEAVDDLGLSIGSDGLEIRRTKAESGNLKEKETASTGELERFKRLHTRTGEKALSDLSAHIRANASTYPLFDSSDCNQEQTYSPKPQSTTTKIFLA